MINKTMRTVNIDVIKYEFIIDELTKIKESLDNSSDDSWWYIDKIDERIEYYKELLNKQNGYGKA